VLIVTPSRRGKKRAAAQERPSSSAKRGRTTNASALEGLAASLGHFGDTIAKALAPPPPVTVLASTSNTPSHCQEAITRALRLETWLSTFNLLTFINILERDDRAVEVYLALENDDFWRVWVQDKIAAVALLL
ncbi:hypothetical protein H0H81_005337, partial [Sphagnurus paluster]